MSTGFKCTNAQSNLFYYSSFTVLLSHIYTCERALMIGSKHFSPNSSSNLFVNKFEFDESEKKRCINIMLK